MANRKLANLSIYALLVASACKSSSGEKDPMILPQIAFKTDAGYVYKDTTVGKSVSLLTGINAAKSEPKDVLKRFTVTRGYDADTIGTAVITQDLTGTQGDNYTADYTISTRSSGGKETYTYTVVNRDGLINQVKLRVTVQ